MRPNGKNRCGAGGGLISVSSKQGGPSQQNQGAFHNSGRGNHAKTDDYRARGCPNGRKLTIGDDGGQIDICVQGNHSICRCCGTKSGVIVNKRRDEHIIWIVWIGNGEVRQVERIHGVVGVGFTEHYWLYEVGRINAGGEKRKFPAAMRRKS